MIKLKGFPFNPLQVNTYLLYNDEQKCIIVDPACIYQEEKNTLSGFIEEQNLEPVMLVNTHCHVDHMVANGFINEKYGLKPMIHEAGKAILDSAPEQAQLMGFPAFSNPDPVRYLNDNEIISLGDDKIEIRYTPGHADGSICLIIHDQKILLSGDVLFANSVGRADLPTGDMGLLRKSIREKLFTLDDDFIVYPGHGPATTIGNEKAYNPFV
ncbi:MAG: MBL fold metallo-hydrolase [Bacteroidota bacterium]